MSSKSPLSRKATDGKKRSPHTGAETEMGMGTVTERDGNASLAEDGGTPMADGRNRLRPCPGPP